ncbi:MAG: ferritin [Puniceicoccales bacterium]|jgi:ferritin|nr:ferritin [Puniceicoccales bacterium]
MKMSDELERLMVEQIRNEIESAYIYLGMSSAMETSSLPGTKKWMRMQAKEEIEHGMKFYDYLHSRGANVRLLPIGQVPTTYDSPLSAFEAALTHEKEVTAMIHKMYDVAVAQKDYESQNMLNWFITEQVEEEEQTKYFCDRFRFAGKDPCAILQIDREAGKLAG